MSLTYTDLFCGAGGSSIGLSAAGLVLKLAANHWAVAIDTHSSNFRDAEHLCADVNNYDMRRLPSTDVLWISPICTEAAPGGVGARRRPPGQLDLLQEGPVEQAGFERTRATFHDAIRAAEVHRYKAVLVENVVDVAFKWELFDWWVQGMLLLGYNVQFVSVSSAHVWGEGNLPAPQWRDRLYMVFTLKGIPLPDVDPRPLAHCFDCGEDVHALQSWKRPGRRIGKYGRQYVYVCPSPGCGHSVVEPYVLPAAAAIDWSDVGVRIGDRPKPLAEATLRRIRVGLEMFAQPTVVAAAGNTWERPGSGYVRAWPALDGPMQARTNTGSDGVAVAPVMVSVNHGGGDGRPYPVDSRPMAARTTKIGEGMAVPPFLVDRYDYNGSDAGRVRGVDQPMTTVTAAGRAVRTMVVPPGAFVTTARRNSHPGLADREALAAVTAGGNHHELTVPPGAFIQKHHGGLDYKGVAHMNKSVDDPLATIVARPNMSLVIPYRRGSRPHPATDRPLSTVATRETHGLMAAAIEVEDCHFRMLTPREHLRAQRFHDGYVVKGNKGAQTRQAGDAVSANVAQWLGERVAEVIA